MSNPLHAAHYADSASHCQVAIDENVRVARDTFRVRVRCDEIARRVLPGQFVMVRLSGCNDPLIGRPLAVYDVVPDVQGAALDLIYHVKGRFTTRLARSERGQLVDLWGPLGNGFPVLPCSHLVMVAGGVGQTPFLTLAKEHLGRQEFGSPPRPAVHVPHVTLCFGAQTQELLAGVGDFETQGVDVRLATDDGTIGHRGLVTELLEEILAAEVPHRRADEDIRVVCCGPEAMLPRGGTSHPTTSCAVSRVPGDAHGVRHRNLLHVRGEDPPGRTLGLQADLRRGARVRRPRSLLVTRTPQ